MDDITSYSHRKLSTILRNPAHPHHAAAKAERDRRAMQRESKDEFEPHMMYDPKTGKGYMARKPADHIRMSKMGYSHDKPKTEGAMKRIATTQSNKTDRMASGGKQGLETFKKREMQKETKGAPKGYHFTRDGKLKKGDAGADGDGGAKLRSDPLDKQRSKIPPLPEKFANAAQQAAVMAKLKKSGKYDGKEAYEEPQSQAKGMMSPLQKLRLDKEKADRDKEGKLKHKSVTSEAVNEAATPAMKKAADELNSYAKKSGGIDKADFMKTAKMLSTGKAGMSLIKFVNGQDTDVYEKILTVMSKHMGKQTIEKMFNVKVREETVSVDEVLDTPKAMDSYKNKAKYSRDRAASSAVATVLRSKDKSQRDHPAKDLKTMDKRTKGLKMADRNATKKTFNALRKEQADLNELDKKTLGSYIKKAGVDGEVQKAKAARHADAGDMADKDRDMYKHYAKSQRAMDKAKNRVKGINKAVDKLTKEATIPDGQTAMTKRPELTNNDKDKLAKIRMMLDREKKKSNEGLEQDGPKKPDIFKKGGSFGRAASANPNIQKYMAKKAAGNQAQNKAMDPGAAKKGYGIGVTDTNKADKKAKAKGTSMMKRMGSRGKMYKAGKMM